ncbi:MAG TPA: YchJ family metal-binding protein [Byssovorax sp.]
MRQKPKTCPCHSGRAYAGCCAPLHRGERAAATPEELMRSRYAAFALGLGDYLVDTLAGAHEDRALPRAALVEQLRRAHETQRFQGLEIAWTDERASEGDVLFVARIFVEGKDRSFAELSTFTREDGAWRYASGVSVPADRLPKDTATLDRDALLALASR